MLTAAAYYPGIVGQEHYFTADPKVASRPRTIHVALPDLTFELDTDATTEQIATLKKLTERYCVVYQTLAAGLTPQTEFHRR